MSAVHGCVVVFDIIVFVAVFAVSYALHTLGVTIGYHRLLTHRSFVCPKALEYLFVGLGYLAFEGSPIWWTTIHRAHHRFQDTPLDPHSPQNGILHAHFGWMFARGYKSHVNPAIQSKDLINDPVYRFLEQGGNWQRAHFLVFAIGLAFRLLILVCFGWVAALASLLAGVIVLQVPLMLNVICHQPKLGYKNYPTGDDSVNVWWVALLAFGEGWHNNHHAFPGSARSGFKRFELDLSWLTLRLLKRIGLIGWMHEESVSSAYKKKLVAQPVRARETIPVLAKEAMPVRAREAMPALAKEAMPVRAKEALSVAHR